MQSKVIKTPGPDHPIEIGQHPERIIITVNGQIIADTQRALTLQEAHYPPVQYIPRQDINMQLLTRTNKVTYCAYKGDCAYYALAEEGETPVEMAWTYEAPYEAVLVIKDYIAFYPDRVEIK